jgi:hypothetical protein
MPSPVFSKLFFRAPSVSGGPFDVYTVPGGKLAVIKCIAITFGDVVASGLDAWVQTDDLCKLARYSYGFSTTTPVNFGGTGLFYGSFVVREFEVMQVQTADGTADFTASGFEFDA